jgi:hypothetical protein
MPIADDLGHHGAQRRRCQYFDLGAELQQLDAGLPHDGLVIDAVWAAEHEAAKKQAEALVAAD